MDLVDIGTGIKIVDVKMGITIDIKPRNVCPVLYHVEIAIRKHNVLDKMKLIGVMIALVDYIYQILTQLPVVLVLIPVLLVLQVVETA